MELIIGLLIVLTFVFILVGIPIYISLLLTVFFSPGSVGSWNRYSTCNTCSITVFV